MEDLSKIKASFEGGYRVSFEIDGKHALTTDIGSMDRPTPVNTLCMAFAACTSAHISHTLALHGVTLEGMTVDIQPVLGESPKRVVEINMDFRFKQDFEDKHKRALERSINLCTVGNSLNPEIKRNVTYSYGVK